MPCFKCNSIKRMIFLIICLMPLFVAPVVVADTIKVAVASNFIQPIRLIAKQFQKETGHSIVLVSGSSGKHFAQIMNGAPFDIFLSADSRRPQILDDKKRIVSGSRFTYAIGKLVLWSPDQALIDGSEAVLLKGEFSHLAMANPALAPYGKAARQVLQHYKLWNTLRPRLVRGESISQAFHFVASGNTPLGLVAYSQIKKPEQKILGSYWLIPQDIYQPIYQQAVLLTSNKVAKSFVDFIKGDSAQNIIKRFGYEVITHAG